MNIKAAIVAVACACISGSTVAWAHWGAPSLMPVERIERKLVETCRQEPGNAQAHALLGRLYGMMYAVHANGLVLSESKSKTSSVQLRDLSDILPAGEQLAAAIVDIYGGGGHTDIEPPVRDLEMGAQAIKHSARAVELDPNNGVYRLGLAYVLYETSDLASTSGLSSLPSVVTGSAVSRADDDDGWRQIRLLMLSDSRQAVARIVADHTRWARQLDLMRYSSRTAGGRGFRAAMVGVQLRCALDQYLKCVALAWPSAQLTAAGQQKDVADRLVALSALESIVMALRVDSELIELGCGVLKPDERVDLERRLPVLESYRDAGPVTPLVLWLEDGTPSIGPRVCFDLDGDSVLEHHDWIDSKAIILSWDPLGTRDVGSGRDLFGNTTWWFMFSNGFEPLQLLDNNGDGWLTHDELSGVRGWIDGNQNAISEPGEVISLPQLGVTAISCHPLRGPNDRFPLVSEVLLESGDRRKCFDWVSHPGG